MFTLKQSVSRNKNIFKNKFSLEKFNLFSFNLIQSKNFARREDFAWESDIQKKLKEKWEMKQGIKKNNNVSPQYSNIRLDVI